MTVAVLSAAYVSLAASFVGICILSTVYVRYYQHKRGREKFPTLVTVCAMAAALVSVAIVPADIYVASSFKDSAGNFHGWATPDVVHSYETTVEKAYYGVYGTILGFIFFLIPFTYFYCDENDFGVTTRERVVAALKFTAVSLFIWVIFFIVGLFVKPNDVTNTGDDFQYIKDVLSANKGENALTFCIGVLTLIGFLVWISYTAYGLFALPMFLIKGRRGRDNSEADEAAAELRATRDQQRTIRARQSGMELNSRERKTLEDLQARERVLARQEEAWLASSQGKWAKCLRVIRPFQFLFGFALFALSLLLFVSLLLTCVDRAMHSAGAKSGYMIDRTRIVNPLDKIMLLSQKAFPLDYCFFVGIVAYIVLCTVSGIKNLGVRCLCVKLFAVKRKRTPPQALLFAIMVLMLAVLALSPMLMTILPQYTTFGNEKYLASGNATTGCTTTAPAGACISTRISGLTIRFFYRMWFFGAAYFYLSWTFVAACVFGCVVSLFRKPPPPSGAGEYDEADDYSSEDDAIVRRNRSRKPSAYQPLVMTE
eukprot:Opistho-2@23637